MTDSAIIFDRMAKRRQRLRTAARFADADFLFREVADRMVDRLLDLTRRFPLAAEIGARGERLCQPLLATGRVDTVLRFAAIPLDAANTPGAQGTAAALADEEFLPLKDASLDLVVSNLALHWVNDLPGTLVQIQRALKPDGLFLAALLGGNTLYELREALAEAEIEREGGLSPRVSPLIDVRDAGMLLQRAGFALPVADCETITVTYEHPLKLMHDLRMMGETNAVAARRKGFTRRTTLLRASEIYAQRHAGQDGRIPATFDVLMLAGWRPDDSQQKALRPGSAKTRLAEALGTTEISAGEKAGR